MLETSFALSIVNERNSSKKTPPLSSPLGGGGDVTGRRDTTEKCVCMRECSVMCMFFSSVTVSQCHREGVQGGGLQLVKGLLLTVDRRGLQCTVYSRSRGLQ